VSLLYLADPHPERWGRQSPDSVLRALRSSAGGLSTAQVQSRRRFLPPLARRNEWVSAFMHQAQSPVTGILAGGALLALLVGDLLDSAIIGVTIGANMVIGVWQEYQADQAAEMLKRMGRATARVLRDGRAVTVSVTDLVPGDVLLLAPGDRVTADARLLEAHGLEVDQATLTGESLPVRKHASGGPDESHVILEGTDVLVGTGRAMIVAVGRQTRLGAMSAALSLDETQQSPLGVRLGRLLKISLPAAAVGGGLVIAAGYLRGMSLPSLWPIGLTATLAAVPEGLPLLAGTGEAGVARRLAQHRALVRRLAAVEALGRVDVACADKTGTMTQGRLALRLLADFDREGWLPGPCPKELFSILFVAGVASPHPDAESARAHPTDLAVIQGAVAAGFNADLRISRDCEVPFDPARPFYATIAQGKLHVKGSPEALAPRCTRARTPDGDRDLDDAGYTALLDRAQRFAERGLRVLLVAEGPPHSAENPQGLIALGFVGISDPLRATVPAAVRRCQEAGVRVIMLTGDHPATARAIAREAGLLCPGREEIITAADIAEVHNGDLDARLERVAAVARATPLDKLRIIEALQRRGHTVAMTGDGANDAPALRLADVGVAMGQAGTEVARQAADLVLADDDFATLVEALVEGRGFWRNMRRALSLLLGGNLGELGVITGASLLGLGNPLNSRQILVVNLITDALPALAVVLQRPEHRRLAGLAREGTSALDTALRRDVVRRGVLTAGPTLAAFVAARRLGGTELANAVAYSTVIATQLAQTLDVGRTEGMLSRSVLSAVAGSTGFLVTTLAVPVLRDALGLGVLSPAGWLLVGAGAVTAVAGNHLLTAATRTKEQA
jgi:calcium-translocating P-type ATPase